MENLVYDAKEIDKIRVNNIIIFRLIMIIYKLIKNKWKIGFRK